MPQFIFSKFSNEINHRDVPAHKTKSKLFQEDYMGISIHKTELANCGSSDRPVNLQDLDFGTRSQFNNLFARNVSIIAENLVNIGQYYCNMHCMKYAGNSRKYMKFTDPYSAV